jgi:hypothetical protein
VLWFIIGEGLFVLMLYNTIAKNALTFIPYFMVGVFSASVFENIHVALWDWNRLDKEKAAGNTTDPKGLNRDTCKDNGFIRFVYDIVHYSDDKAVFPWVHSNYYFSYFYVSQVTPNANQKTADYGLDKSLNNNENVNSSTPLNSGSSLLMKSPVVKRSTFFYMCAQLWRFFPDLMSISIGFLMSTLGNLNTPAVGSALWFIILPTVFIAFWVVQMFQKGSSRYNFSRFFLECNPIATMGYASYAMYLFQRMGFAFYAPYFYFGVIHHKLDQETGDPNQWFERLNGGYKVIAVVIFTIICWLVHKYFQDGFVTYWYARLIQSYSKRGGTADVDSRH